MCWRMPAISALCVVGGGSRVKDGEAIEDYSLVYTRKRALKKVTSYCLDQ